MSSTDVPQALLERYKRVAIPTVEDVLRSKGYVNIFMKGVRRVAGKASSAHSGE